MKSIPALVVSRLLLFIVVGTSVTKAHETPCEIADVAWEPGPNLPEFRKGGCATVLDGKVISVFGMRQPWGEMATMYVYDPKANSTNIRGIRRV